MLGDSAERRKERFTRPDLIIAGLKEDDEPELDMDQVSVWTLLEAFDGIMQATGHYADYDHIQDDTPIDLYQIEILHRLQTEGPMTFEKIFEDRGNRIVLMGLFLALLELIRDCLVWAEQAGQLDSVYLRALTDKPAEKAVQDAIYANVDLEEKKKGEKSKVKSEEKPKEPSSGDVERSPILIQEVPAEKKPSEVAGNKKLSEVRRNDSSGEENGWEE